MFDDSEGIRFSVEHPPATAGKRDGRGPRRICVVDDVATVRPANATPIALLVVVVVVVVVVDGVLVVPLLLLFVVEVEAIDVRVAANRMRLPPLPLLLLRVIPLTGNRRAPRVAVTVARPRSIKPLTLPFVSPVAAVVVVVVVVAVTLGASSSVVFGGTTALPLPPLLVLLLLLL
jgi:hypothetical protein